MASEKRGIYQGLSLPVSLIEEVKKHIEKRPQYKGVTEFVRESIREKMERDIILGDRAKLRKYNDPIEIMRRQQDADSITKHFHIVDSDIESIASKVVEMLKNKKKSSNGNGHGLE